MVVGSRRPVGGDHLLRLHVPVQLADPVLEGGQAEDVPIGEPPGAQRLQKGPLVLAGEGEQLVQGHRVHAGLGDIIFGPHLVLVHPLFYQKRFDVHKTAPSQNLDWENFTGADIIRPFFGIAPPSCGRLIAAPTWIVPRRGGTPGRPPWGFLPFCGGRTVCALLQKITVTAPPAWPDGPEPPEGSPRCGRSAGGSGGSPAPGRSWSRAPPPPRSPESSTRRTPCRSSP